MEPEPITTSARERLRMAGGSSSVDPQDLLKRLVKFANICETCGAQYEPFPRVRMPPAKCIICDDERQFVPTSGQRWVKHEQLKQSGKYHNMWQKLEPGLYGIATTPKLAIGQRAFIVQTPHGNLLWDCISFLDDATIDLVKALGGLRAIAISHPHFYASNGQWSTAFGGIPVYIHEKDKEWVTYKHDKINYWSGESLPLWEGLTILKLGGHFAGASILHWASGANGEGAVLSGDTLQVGMNLKSVSIMRSFPNYIPLSSSKAQRIAKIMERLKYDRLYGAFFGLDIEADAKSILKISLDRYGKWVDHNDLDI